MSKKNIFIIVGIAAVVVVGGLGFAAYKFFVPPSSASVCDKVRDIGQKYLNDNGLRDTKIEDLTGSREECIKKEDEATVFRGPQKTHVIRNCIMDAKDFEALSECAEQDK